MTYLGIDGCFATCAFAGIDHTHQYQARVVRNAVACDRGNDCGMARMGAHAHSMAQAEEQAWVRQMTRRTA